MAHEIWENRVFTGRGKPPWHKLGITIDGLATWQESMGLAGLDWQVEKILDIQQFDSYSSLQVINDLSKII